MEGLLSRVGFADKWHIEDQLACLSPWIPAPGVKPMKQIPWDQNPAYMHVHAVYYMVVMPLVERICYEGITKIEEILENECGS